MPDDKLGWKPHEKSGTMGWLANHVAKLPRLAVFAIEQDSVDVAQLGVYLRLNNIPVPAIYGPSAGGGVL